jgi:ERCC4-type nuclease
MVIFVDSQEPPHFCNNLDCEVKALPEGDFWIELKGKRVVIERKTWDDAYNSWMQKRLEEQISRILENHDDYILLIEGNKQSSRLWRNKQFHQLESLQKFLNRMSLEVIPVIYTTSKRDTCSYLNYLSKRIDSGEYMHLIRKTTVLKSSRNKYHNIMSLIPGITIERSKLLFDLFDDLPDFINNVDKAITLDSENKRWITNVRKIKEFILCSWENTPERELIVEKGNS